jgi:hypothetical protein
LYEVRFLEGHASAWPCKFLSPIVRKYSFDK